MLASCKRPTFYLASFLACGFMALNTGCASGGFKLTRQYAGFVNKQQLIIRIILYILTGIVFAATLLIDLVIFNTMDFWEGRVSAGEYNFKDGDKTFYVQHSFQPGTKLKHSVIKVSSPELKVPQEVVLNETASGEIEVFIDGKLRSKVHSLSAIPMASIYNESGKRVEERVIPLSSDSSLVAAQ